MIKNIIAAVIVILYGIVVTHVFMNLSSRTPPSASDDKRYENTQSASGGENCEIRCSEIPPSYIPCPQKCTIGKRHDKPNSPPKQLYGTREVAICAALHFSRKHNDGRGIYRCPRGADGFHTTTASFGVDIEIGKIIDVDGKDISEKICQ